VCVGVVSSLSLDGDEDNYNVEEEVEMIGGDSLDILDSSMNLGKDRESAEDRMGCDPETITRPLFWVLTRTKMIKRMTSAIGCTQSMCFSPKSKYTMVCPSKKTSGKKGIPPAIQITLIQDRSKDDNYQGLIRPSKTRVAAAQNLIDLVQDRDAVPGCKNNHPSCVAWSKVGECDKNCKYMHVQCKVACGKCNSIPCEETGGASGGGAGGGAGAGGAGGAGGGKPAPDPCKPVIVNRPPVWFYTTTVTTKMQVTKLQCVTNPTSCEVTSRIVKWDCNDKS